MEWKDFLSSIASVNLIDPLRDGHVLVIVGAGISIPKFLTWDQLDAKVCQQLLASGVPATPASTIATRRSGGKVHNFTNFKDLAAKNPGQLWRFISENFGDHLASDRIKRRYDHIAATNFRGVITLNVDEQVRAGFVRVGRPIAMVASWKDSVGSSMPSGQLLRDIVINPNWRDWIINLHGDRYHPDECVLDNETYDQVWASDGPGPALVSSLNTLNVLFLGCKGLFSDPDALYNAGVRTMRKSLSAQPWYALVSKNELDEPLMHELGITPLYFANAGSDYLEIDEFLRVLFGRCPYPFFRSTYEDYASRPLTIVSSDPTVDCHEESLVSEFDKDTNHFEIAGSDTHTQLFPNNACGNIWYRDDAEERAQRISIRQVECPNIWNEVLLEQSRTAARDDPRLNDIVERLKEGSNDYPRLVDIPARVESGLQITVAMSQYRLTLLAENQNSGRLDLPALSNVMKSHNLNSLAVRVGVTYTDRRGRRRLLFHQRKARSNATYNAAWDVSAAGYVNARSHTDAAQLSPWKACSAEILEELGIELEHLPYREEYRFFGVIRNTFTGQLDILATVDLSGLPRVAPTAKVEAVQDCELDPAAIAEFIAARKWWVPTAVVCAILILETSHSRTDIGEFFSRAGVFERITLKPFCD
jgi:hypothetical protein